MFNAVKTYLSKAAQKGIDVKSEQSQLAQVLINKNELGVKITDNERVKLFEVLSDLIDR